MTYTALDLLRDLRLLAEGLEQISLGLAQAADQLHTIHQRCDPLYATLSHWRGVGDGEAEREEEKT